MNNIREQLRQELLADSKTYCCYCGNEQTGFSCCRENHFESFSNMSHQAQEDFLDAEYGAFAAAVRNRGVSMNDCKQHMWEPVEGQPLYKCARCGAFLRIIK